ncbi:HAD family hydrolase [Aeromicrobium sp. Root472D3]|uniref:HAD family hydrolase n=1 Tax=Aeromicrobium sp. Root472D3 TaxID=1736540 RepID=UPI0006FDBDC0|nr:HAD hydrolase-like protein [Aeromicrobium sp. Root472D3]KQX73986.1 haloacid dehalogenase [Aeromicrobium sp. Root472D3]
MTTTGFDLDMTLIDSRPGIRAVYDRIVEESGATIDVDVVVSRLGPPVEQELAQWMPADDAARWADRYREIYPGIALELISTLPGAHAAVDAARSRGRAILITAKHAPSATLHLERLGIEVDEVFGRAWREGKADVLRAQGAGVYVGDHVHDMEAARSSGAFGVGVTTGPCDADELRAAGAGHVLTSLELLPGWFAQHA